MKIVRFLIVLLISMRAVAHPPIHGGVYGVALDSSGHPARNVRLIADQLGADGLSRLGPADSTRTDQDGKFRFEAIPVPGTYIISAEDEPAGYSRGSSWPSEDVRDRTVILSLTSPKAELDLHLPPKAGFLLIELTDRKTGRAVHKPEISVLTDDEPPRLVFHWTGYSDRVVLVPSGKPLLLHVSSSGFHEWSESVGKGHSLRLRPMERLTLRVALDPAD